CVLYFCFFFFFFFFFSSRRRHTRFSRDWSSDVCSSDLFTIRRLLQSVAVMLTVAFIAFALFNFVGDPINNMVGQDTSQQDRDKRSEERRVGKECRSRWSPDH